MEKNKIFTKYGEKLLLKLNKLLLKLNIAIFWLGGIFAIIGSLRYPSTSSYRNFLGFLFIILLFAIGFYSLYRLNKLKRK